jgi:serine/threonine-protein kinase
MGVCYDCKANNSPSIHYCSCCSSPLLLQDRYRIIEIIGGGGRGKVYRAEQVSLRRKVAIKEIVENILNDPQEKAEAIRLFNNEAQILGSLDHRNLPKVHDFFSENDRLYLVMDYIDGQTLEQLIESSSSFLPEAKVIEWAIEVCDVLEYLHTQNPPIIFRDIKPGNIMLTKTGQIKLIDFGIARLFNPAKGNDTVIMGTMGYAPPEQYSKKGSTEPRSDIYALGATLYHLISRHDPTTDIPFFFPNKDVRSFNPNISIPFADVIHRATQTDRSNRFGSAVEMRAALEAIRYPQRNPPDVPPPLHQGNVVNQVFQTGELGNVINPSANRVSPNAVRLMWTSPPRVYRIYVCRTTQGPARSYLDPLACKVAILEGSQTGCIDDKAPSQSLTYTFFCLYQVREGDSMVIKSTTGVSVPIAS